MPRVMLQVQPSSDDGHERWLAELTRTARRLGYWGVSGAPCDSYIGETTAVRRAFLVFENGMSRDAIASSMQSWGSRYAAPSWRGWYERYRMISQGLLIAGTVDDVKRQVEGLLLGHPVEYLVWMLQWSVVPRRAAISMVELFASEILPELGLEAPPLALAAGTAA
jgi:hypothetical protein